MSRNDHSRVTIHLPQGRELLWVTPDSPIVAWEVGQAVAFRNESWIVLRRAEDDQSLSLTLELARSAPG
jgi:hypothetical protein